MDLLSYHKTPRKNEKINEAILQYRQALRDITLQSDPFNIVWPAISTNIQSSEFSD